MRKINLLKIHVDFIRIKNSVHIQTVLFFVAVSVTF